MGLDELEDVRLRHGRLGRPTGRARSEGLGVLGVSRYWGGLFSSLKELPRGRILGWRYRVLKNVVPLQA